MTKLYTVCELKLFKKREKGEMKNSAPMPGKKLI
jgi:hypothetical protein